MGWKRNLCVDKAILNIRIMEYLFDVWGKVRGQIDNNAKVLLLLDYDGTITPIVERPELAILSEETRNLLLSISRLSKYALCIVSGRPLEDVRKLVGIEGIYYVGNHGLESVGSDVNYINPDAFKTKPIINELHQKLTGELKHIEGILLEHKNITLAVHYRMVSEKNIPEVRDIFTRVVQPYLERHLIKIAANKKTLEVLPNVDWDKGKMILQILNLLSYDTITIPKIDWSNIRGAVQILASTRLKSVLPVYIGDDATDEDAFMALGDSGVSILVSEQIRASHAQYYLKDVNEVVGFLKILGET